MPIPLHVLIVEDSEADAHLMLRELRKGGFDPIWERVETPEGMRAALEQQAWEIILSDYTMPSFSAPAALLLLQESGRDIPFIIVSGTIGEETAVAAMRAGAQDYLLKNNLTRMVPAIVRELRESEIRAARRQAEADLQTVNRGLRVLSMVNQALLRDTTVEDLFLRACQIAVNEGGYRMVWVGIPEHVPDKTVHPVCHAGFEEGYLGITHFSWDAASASGQGPTGTAIRTGQPAFVRDIATIPESAPWREEAIKRGYRSAIVIPMLINSHVIGTFNLYGSMPDAFPPEEVRLLTEMANDMAYGIMALRARERREQAEAELRNNEERLRIVLATLPVGVAILDGQGRVINTNTAFEHIWAGAAPAIPEVTDIATTREYRGWLSETGHELTPEEWASSRALLRGETTVGEIIDIQRFDGTHGAILNNAAPLRDTQGAITGAVVVLQDISDLRRAEQEVRQREAMLDAFFANSPGILNLNDDALRYLNTDPTTPTYFGLTRQTIVGKSVQALAPDFVEAYGPMMHRVIETGESVRNVEVQSAVPGRPGETTYWLASYFPVPLPMGKRGIGIMGVDITDRKRAEEALRISEAKYRTLFAVEPDALLLVDTDTLRILEANDAALRLYGYTPEEFLALDALAISAEPDATRCQLQSIKAREIIRIPQRIHVRKDGTVFTVEITESALDWHGQHILVAAIRDITDRLRTEETIARERAYLASAIELLPMPLFFVTPAREIIRQNKASRDMQHEASNQFWWSIRLLDPQTRSEVPAQYWPVMKALQGEVVQATEWFAVLPDDREIPILLYSAPVITDEGILAAVVAIQDISVLKEADRAKNQFLMMVSHELRTPLTSIIGWAQMAQDAPETASDALPIILRSARKFESMLERLVILSRILTDKISIRPQPIDLCRLTCEVFDTFRAAMEAKYLSLHCPSPAETVTIPGDRHLLQMALNEMADNAVKFSPEHGSITLSCHHELSGTVVISVSDTGRGITPEELPNLMKPFVQLRREEQLGGAGIGLALVQGIVRAHHGRVYITSPGPGQGTTVTLELPADLAPPAATP